MILKSRKNNDFKGVKLQNWPSKEYLKSINEINKIEISQKNSNKIKMIKLSSLKENPKNPRTISEENLEKLCKSLKDFPKMLELRPIVVDDKNIVLAGNMRLKALKKLGYKEIPENWVKKASDLTEEDKKQFLIKDNLEYGIWNEEILNLEFDTFDLKEWNLDLDIEMNFDNEDYSDKNKEVDVNDLGDEGIIKLKFNSEIYFELLDRLNKLKSEKDTNESLFLKILEYYEKKS